MRGEGECARLLESRFESACRRLQLNEDGRYEMDTGRFRAPNGGQGTLF